MTGPGCGDGDVGPDDAGVHVPPVDCQALSLRWSQPWIATTPGVTRKADLVFGRDSNCVDAQLVLSASEPGVVSFEPVVTIPQGHSRVSVPITGEAEGEVTLTATWRLTTQDVTASMGAFVSDGSLPACDGSAAGTVSPGDTLEVPSGSLSGARVGLPEGAGRDDDYGVAPFEGSVACAADQVPDGYLALGPAVTIGPAHLRMRREIPVRIPMHSERLPEGAHHGHVQVSYTGPGVIEPRIVPFSSPEVQGEPGQAWLAFQTRRLGTFQALVREEPPAPRAREYTFHAITGVSMGAGGAALVGLGNPDAFDFVAPMGGPVEWRYLLHYIRTYHLGGFCSEDERQADAAAMCELGADVSRTPESRWLHEHRQDFEHWHYVDEYDGQGGTFDRRQYIRIFRDLTRMYGNANTTHEGYPDGPNITPPGVDAERASWTDEALCGEGVEPVVIPPCQGTFPDCAAGTGYIDDEYNPQGQYPVITFCDGGEIRVDGVRDVGTWDPDGDHTMPVEVAVAVDINGNFERDPGEPVIRSGHEPFEDCGLDGLCNPDEPGYDPVTNPDPNGDDYDPLFNPTGTEGNGVRDSVDGDPCTEEGEHFDDVGLDGVAGTRQMDAQDEEDRGYDLGEDNGCWDMAQGLARMLASDGREMAMRMPEDVLRDVDVFTDGGIRDLFNFGVVHEHFIGGFVGRDRNVRMYNGHAALLGGRTDHLDLAQVPWAEVGRHVLVRYGDPDATETQKIQGDGGHVGTAGQLLDRVNATLAWISAGWPDGDRDFDHDEPCEGCETTFTFDFEAVGRRGPVGVVLPPGYHNPENADRDYPIVYFLHGYGQQPQDLVDIGFILRGFMTNPTIPRHARLQKMIIVFPDGRCRGDECIRGTFYADAPEPHTDSPPMETWMRELMAHMRGNFRVKAPATFETVD